MVRKEGFEPPRPFGHKILSLARLPVPPLPHGSYSIGCESSVPSGFLCGHWPGGVSVLERVQLWPGCNQREMKAALLWGRTVRM
jgi:hypothetical protein